MSKTAQETYLDRIKAIKSQRKITNDRLSDMTGIPLGTLSKLLAGINDSPKLSNIVAISEALGCSLDYLITGIPQNTHNFTLEDDEILLVDQYRALDEYGRTLVKSVLQLEQDRIGHQKDQLTVAIREAEAQTEHRIMVRHRADAARRRYTAERPQAAELLAQPTPQELDRPVAQVLHLPSEAPVPSETSIPTGATAPRRSITLYDLPVSAGAGEFLADEHARRISIPDLPQTAPADFALRIVGDSMEPAYHEGDMLLIQRTESVAQGELGIFLLDGCGYFKKFGGDRLISLNPAYPPILLKDYSSTACCGRVIGRMRRK